MENYFIKRYLILLILLVLGIGLISCHRSSGVIPESLPDPAGLMKIEKPSYKLRNGALLDEQAAIQAAEKFIADNGYTDLPPLADPRQLTNESIEWESEPDKKIKLRHNSLERDAYSVSPGSRNGLGWTVGFRYKDGDSRTGRAVTMDRDGGNIRVEHQDIFLQFLEKKLNH